MKCRNVTVSVPPFDQRWLHDKDVLPLSLQQSSSHSLNRCFGTEETEAETGKVFPLHQQVSRPFILQHVLILLECTSSRNYPLHCPHLCCALSIQRCPDSRCTALPPPRQLRRQTVFDTQQRVGSLERTLRMILGYYRRDFSEIEVLESAKKGSKPPDCSHLCTVGQSDHPRG